MAYDLKDVFYLDASATMDNSTSGAGAAQLDLSAYVDPIARGRSKGTGLAVYKAYFSIGQTSNGGTVPNASETGLCNYGIVAGWGLGDFATAAISNPDLGCSNSLLIAAGQWAGQANPTFCPPTNYIEPSEKVPYVVVRDNIGLLYEVAEQFATDTIVSVRMECAQVSLDQATLNQLLRTQTV